MIDKIKFDNIDEEAVATLAEPSYNNIMKVAIDYSDALIVGSETIPSELQEHLKESDKPTLEYHTLETFAEAYTEFYNTKVLS
jgi:starch synthase